MIPSQKLVDALRRAADKIERTPDNYDWNIPERCNCGLLAQELGISPSTIFRMTMYETNECIWSENACPSTGLPLHHVITTLREIGVTADDIVALENLSDPMMRARAGIPTWGGYTSAATGKHCYGDHDDAEKVVAYMRAWADLLAAQLTPPVAVRVEQPCTHLYMFGLCAYCCSVEPVKLREGVEHA